MHGNGGNVVVTHHDDGLRARGDGQLFHAAAERQHLLHGYHDGFGAEDGHF